MFRQTWQDYDSATGRNTLAVSRVDAIERGNTAGKERIQDAIYVCTNIQDKVQSDLALKN